MPVKLSALVANTASIHLDFGAAGDLTIVYRPALINERTFASLSISLPDGAAGGASETAAAEAKTAAMTSLMAGVNAELCRIVAAWDLTDDADVAIPLTPEALSELPLAMRVQVLSEIANDLRMGELSGSVSKPPSRSGRRSAARATGSSRLAARSRTGSPA